MRIVIDMQGAQTASRFRGIGRYTMALAQALVRQAVGRHEVVLALNGLFPETLDPIREAFAGLLPESSIVVWESPGPVREIERGNAERRERAELLREACLVGLSPDVVFIPSLFEGFIDDAVGSIGRLGGEYLTCVTVHDLIPLLNPDQYLKPNPAYKAYYHRKIDHLRKAALILAISESSRAEALSLLEVTEDRVVNTSEAVDECFRVKHLPAELASTIKRELGIQRPFLLYAGGADERKNLDRLIKAYAGLPDALRTQHQLVFAGKLSAGEQLHLEGQVQRAGLANTEVLFTGYVMDEQLIDLYNLCHAFVFPSWHEGFGLPALEAMACGAAVIGANTSSLPEVIGNPEALFDPMSVESIRDKLLQVVEDASFVERLRTHSRTQCAKFSWDESAQRAISAFERVVGAQVERAWAQTQDAWAASYSATVVALADSLSASDDESLRALARCMEHNEAQAKALARAKPLPEMLRWRLEGPFDSSYSLALVNRELARALAELGHEVALHSTEGPGDFEPNPAFLAANPDLATMHARAPGLPSPFADVVSRNLYPPRVRDMSSRFNLLHGYAWEETGFPREWVENFNLSLQGIAVTSEHVRKILIDNGVALPMVVTGNGVDHWERIVPAPGPALKARAFRFLHVSSCFPRKGADVMLKAYGRAFRAQDDVSLVIKTFANPHNQIRQWLAEARGADPEFPDVQIIEGDLSDAELKALYEQCHVLVAPSRAEGFGLPLAEAMLSGLAVVTTAWSGQLDFCSAQTAWMVDFEYERAQTHFEMFSSVWATPREEDLARVMREVFAAPEDVRRQRSAAGRKLLLAEYRWRDVACRVVSGTRQLVGRPAQTRPRIGWISTWNTRCGIATYSEHLLECFPGDVTVLAARTHDRTAPDTVNVHRVWEAGEWDTLKELSEAIERSRLDTLVVQFNYGFFNFETLDRFLNAQLTRGVRVFFVLHATTDPAHAPHKKLASLRSVLARCHRVIVHSPTDLNRLKTLGLLDNVTLFPHGIKDWSASAGVSTSSSDQRPFTIGSYGFFLPQKGLLELIRAVGMLRRAGMKVCLRMVNAEYPVKESADLIAEARKLVEQSGLRDAVEMNTEFLADEQSVELLAQADLVVYPYGRTGESASGAVRYGLSLGKPVAVTPSSIFDDVRPVVFTLPGAAEEDLAAGLKELIGKLQARTPEVLQRAEASARWRREHDYLQLGQRLYGMIVGVWVNAGR